MFHPTNFVLTISHELHLQSINYLEVESGVSLTNGNSNGNPESANDFDLNDSTNSSSDDAGDSSDSEYRYTKKKKRKISNISKSGSLLAALEASEDDEENEYKLQRQKNMEDRLNVIKYSIFVQIFTKRNSVRDLHISGCSQSYGHR